MIDKQLKTDKQLKSEAFIKAKKDVFENMNPAKDIYVECSDGVYVRRVWKNLNGNFN